jgi:hypothetical protein
MPALSEAEEDLRLFLADSMRRDASPHGNPDA